MATNTETNLSARDLVALHVNARTMADLPLEALGRLHRELQRALVDVDQALAPRIAEGALAGLTYVELATAAGYGSTTTITRIMKAQGAGRGSGGNQVKRRRSSVVGCTCGSASRSLYQHDPQCEAQVEGGALAAR